MSIENEPDNQSDRDLALIDRHIHQLMEHFDAVQIFAVRHDGQIGTIACRKGAGNWYARYGIVHEWLVREDESFRITQREQD